MAKKLDFKDFLTVDYAPGMDPLIKRNAKKRKSNETETSGPSESVNTTGNYGTQTQRLMSPLQKVRQDKEKDDRDRDGKIKAGVLPRSKGPSEAVAPGGKAPKPVSGKAAQAYIDGGKHVADVTMGREGKHGIIKSPNSKKHVHVFTYESVEDIEEALTPQQRRTRAMGMRRIQAKISLGRDRAARRFADPERLKSRAHKEARSFIFRRLSKGASKEDLTYQRRQDIEKRMDTPQMKKRIDMLATKLLKKVRAAEIQRHQKNGQQSQND